MRTATRELSPASRSTCGRSSGCPGENDREAVAQILLDVGKQLENLQVPGLEQVGVVDDDHRMTVVAGELFESAFEATEDGVLAVGDGLGGFFVESQGQVSEEFFRFEKRVDQADERRVGLFEFGLEDAGDEGLADPVPAGEQAESLTVLDEVAEFEQRPLMSSGGVVEIGVCVILERGLFELPVSFVHDRKGSAAG